MPVLLAVIKDQTSISNQNQTIPKTIETYLIQQYFANTIDYFA